MPKSRFSRVLRNKLNNNKEIDVAQYHHQQLESTFLAKKSTTSSGPKGIKRRKNKKTVAGSERERAAQKTLRHEGEDEDSELYGTPNNDSDSTTLEQTETKTKNWQDYKS